MAAAGGGPPARDRRGGHPRRLPGRRGAGHDLLAGVEGRRSAGSGPPRRRARRRRRPDAGRGGRAGQRHPLESQSGRARPGGPCPDGRSRSPRRSRHSALPGGGGPGGRPLPARTPALPARDHRDAHRHPDPRWRAARGHYVHREPGVGPGGGGCRRRPARRARPPLGTTPRQRSGGYRPLLPRPRRLAPAAPRTTHRGRHSGHRGAGCSGGRVGAIGLRRLPQRRCGPPVGL